MSSKKNAQYQQNVDIIKGFFRKPIVLVTGILTIVVSVAISVLKYLATFDFADVLNSLFEEYGNVLLDPNSDIIAVGFDSTIKEKVFSLDFFTIAFGVAFILLFAFGRSKSNNIQGGVTFYKVLATIEYVVYFILAVCLILVGIFLFTTELSVIAKLIFMIISLVAGVFVFVLGYSQLRFAKSVKESMNSIYLSSTGAKMFGVAQIISAGAILLYIIGIGCLNFLWGGIRPAVLVLSVTPAVLLFVNDLIYGIMALKYDKYIDAICTGKINMPVAENFEKTEIVQEVPQDNSVCGNCGNPVTEEDVFCHICGNKVK